jgi:hypothetical protein
MSLAENILNTLRTGDADLRLYAYKQFKYLVPNVLTDIQLAMQMKQNCPICVL